MGKIDPGNQETFQIPNTQYKFSGARLDDLAASEYTLVSIVFDESGSTSPFARDMEKAIGEILESCKKSPRKDNLLIRVVAFADSVREVHGFKPLVTCQSSDYDGLYQTGGCTALYDAIHNVNEASSIYSKNLTGAGYRCNAINFTITDGQDNRSRLRPTDVAASFKEAVTSEATEGLVSILIGVNVQDAGMASYLNKLGSEAFTPLKIKQPDGTEKDENFIALADASGKTLARLAQFVSQSISSTSSNLANSQPNAQSLTF